MRFTAFIENCTADYACFKLVGSTFPSAPQTLDRRLPMPQILEFRPTNKATYEPKTLDAPPTEGEAGG